MSNKRLISTLLLLLAIVITLPGCLPLPGSKTRASSSDGDTRSTDEKTKGYLNLTAALLMQNEHTMALQELDKVKAISPKNVDMENYYGLAYYGLKEYKLATQSYLKALEMDPKRTDARNNLGLVYLSQKQYDKAIEEFNICIQDISYEKKHMPMANLGLTYLEMGRYDEALDALKKATLVAPAYAKAYQTIGRVYLAQNLYRDALDYLNNAAKLNPSDHETYMALGETLGLLGLHREAAEAYSRVTILVPNTPIALEAQKRARHIMGFE